VVLNFDLVKTGGGFIKLLSFQLQVLYGNIVLSVKAALFRKKLLEESVTVTKCVI